MTEPEKYKDFADKNGAIAVITIYSPAEASMYLLDDYLKNPTKAEVIKQIKYKKSPVVNLGTLNEWNKKALSKLREHNA